MSTFVRALTALLHCDHSDNDPAEMGDHRVLYQTVRPIQYVDNIIIKNSSFSHKFS